MFLLLLFMSLFPATISNTVSSGMLNRTIFTILRLFNVITGKKDKRKGCPLFFNIDFPWPKIIHIRNPYALNQCGHLLWHFAIHQQTTAPQSGHTLLTQVRSMCSWTLPCVSFLVPAVLHLSHGFQCSPTLNRQPYEERLPLTSWWRKLSNMTVGQSSLISLAHHCYDWHPGSRCG